LLNGQIQRTRWENEIFPLIKEMGKAIELASICGLGRSVPIPLMTAAAFFQEDVTRHLSGNGAAPAIKSKEE
jgi:NADH:ubiquinone oxidoreductase subunit F (NADH-binding)